MKILENLKETREYELLVQIAEAYNRIENEQKEWYDKANFFCPEACGNCCHDFEPDLLESEALFMAAWLIENQLEVALKIAEGIFPFENGKTCPFHDFSNPYHCSIYGGRPAICRLFGASCAKSKTGERVWKPCKFYPIEKLQLYNPLLSHKQFSQNEVEQILGKMPPLMSDLMEQIQNITFSKTTMLIRQILPETIRKLLWILQMSGNRHSNKAC